MKFVIANLIPRMNDSVIHCYYAELVHAITANYEIDIGGIIYEEFLSHRNSVKPLVFPCLITVTCAATGVPDIDIIVQPPQLDEAYFAPIARAYKAQFPDYDRPRLVGGDQKMTEAHVMTADEPPQQPQAAIHPL